MRLKSPRTSSGIAPAIAATDVPCGSTVTRVRHATRIVVRSISASRATAPPGRRLPAVSAAHRAMMGASMSKRVRWKATCRPEETAHASRPYRLVGTSLW
ncbi:hypothetical protein Sm713_11590 [Streptomyces sp. TS71-3]|nr:hypothetical protein Sm713_11590 [Streptomyces sp. TS71-3]